MVRPIQSGKVHPEPLVTIRTALILLLGTLSGIAAAVLTVVAGRQLAEAALAGITALAAGIKLFHALID